MSWEYSVLLKKRLSQENSLFFFPLLCLTCFHFFEDLSPAFQLHSSWHRWWVLRRISDLCCPDCLQACLQQCYNSRCLRDLPKGLSSECWYLLYRFQLTFLVGNWFDDPCSSQTSMHQVVCSLDMLVNEDLVWNLWKHSRKLPQLYQKASLCNKTQKDPICRICGFKFAAFFDFEIPQTL